jgi:HAD superfamily hydrolase (TIGR01549 family)
VTLRSDDQDGSSPHDRSARFVLFDLDNTLIDRQLAFMKWASSFAKGSGLGADAVEFLCEADEDGFATREALFEAARERLRLTEPVDDLIVRYRTEYPQMFQPDPAVLAALRRLRLHRFRIGVVTNGPVTQNEKLARTGLSSLVDGVCISEEFGVEKPDPRIFAEAIRRCCGDEVPREGGWMVGDTVQSDIAGARTIGLRSIWMARGRTWAHADFVPDAIASDVPDAAELILRMSKAL